MVGAEVIGIQTGASMENIRFAELSGQYQSKRENFESLCFQLIKKEFPNAFTIDGSKGEGDDGIDICVGDRENDCTIYQCKYYLYSILDTQKTNIRKSFKRAKHKNRGLKHWILLLPMELGPSERSWFETFSSNNPDIEISFEGREYLFSLLAKHPDVSEMFFPQEEKELIREIHDATVGSRVTDRITCELMASNQQESVGRYLTSIKVTNNAAVPIPEISILIQLDVPISDNPPPPWPEGGGMVQVRGQTVKDNGDYLVTLSNTPAKRFVIVPFYTASRFSGSPQTKIKLG